MGQYRPVIKHTIDNAGNNFWQLLGMENLSPYARGDFEEQLRRLARDHNIEIIESR